MASSIGAAVSWHVTVRPVFFRAIKPAPDNTSRCFMMAGSDIEKGSASSLTDRLLFALNRASRARRVGSARAANVRSSTGGLHLTIRLTFRGGLRACQAATISVAHQRVRGPPRLIGSHSTGAHMSNWPKCSSRPQTAVAGFGAFPAGRGKGRREP